MNIDSYAARGVSSDKAEVHQAIRHLSAGLYTDTFCKLLPDVAAHDPAYCLTLHADTAGTKASLAYLYWRETGDLSVWKGIAQDALVMNIDDLLCVGAGRELTISSTIARNKHKIPADVLDALIGGTAELLEEWAQWGLHIHHAGGETADVGDLVRTIDVGFTAFARMPRAEVIRCQVQPGDVIVGLASDGQTTYETQYNSGIGSNGLTGARHDLLDTSYATLYPESFDPAIPPNLVYTGMNTLTEPIAGTEQTIGQLALSPTRTYAPVLLPFIGKYRDQIHGIIHCTGGGQTKCLKFLPGLHAIKDRLFAPPVIFERIQASRDIPAEEMYQTYNMGHRMEVYTDPATAQALIDWAAKFNLAAQVVGHVQTSITGRSQLTLHALGQVLDY